MKPIEGPSCAPAFPGVDPEPGQGVDVQFRGFRPLYEVEGRTGENREAALRANLAIRKEDLEAYRAQIATHLEEAKTCESREALLRHGRWRLPEPPPLPRGMTEREARQLERVHERFVTATKDALSDLGAVKDRLEGRRSPLDVSVEASVSAKVVAGGFEAGVRASVPDASVTASAGVPVVAARSDLKRDGRVEDRIEVGAGGAKWTLHGDRIESFSFERGVLYGEVAGATVSAGLKAARTLGSEGGRLRLEVQANAGFSMTGLDPETARRAISREDSWALTPAE